MHLVKFILNIMSNSKCWIVIVVSLPVHTFIWTISTTNVPLWLRNINQGFPFIFNSGISRNSQLTLVNLLVGIVTIHFRLIKTGLRQAFDRLIACYNRSRHKIWSMLECYDLLSATKTLLMNCSRIAVFLACIFTCRLLWFPLVKKKKILSGLYLLYLTLVNCWTLTTYILLLKY